MFTDRIDAGRRLADALLTHLPDLAAEGPPLVLGLPRGGVVTAAQVARLLKAPLDALIVRKVGYPFQPEVAIGAIGPDGEAELGRHPALADLPPDLVEDTVASARDEWERRNRLLRGGRPGPEVAGRTVIVVDDGVATGSTAVAALRWLKKAGAGRIVMAVPVAPEGTEELVDGLADDLLVLLTPQDFFAVGQVYRDFGQVADQEVLGLLATPPGPSRSGE
jgi:predicted phosphoribosyltransferase